MMDGFSKVLLLLGGARNSSQTLDASWGKRTVELLPPYSKISAGGPKTTLVGYKAFYFYSVKTNKMSNMADKVDQTRLQKIVLKV